MSTTINERFVPSVKKSCARNIINSSHYALKQYENRILFYSFVICSSGQNDSNAIQGARFSF